MTSTVRQALLCAVAKVAQLTCGLRLFSSGSGADGDGRCRA